jgi:hypothetical protein
MTTRIELNKDLSVDYTEWKKNITSKGYSYYDFSREEVERIAKKNVKEVSTTEIRTLAQALFPQYLQCSGLFDGFLFFEVIDGVRVDPPKYCYETCNSYLDNDGRAKVNRLIEEIEDMFEQNEIDCSEDWKNYFRQAKEKAE